MVLTMLFVYTGLKNLNKKGHLRLDRAAETRPLTARLPTQQQRTTPQQSTTTEDDSTDMQILLLGSSCHCYANTCRPTGPIQCAHDSDSD